ncbi:MAG TPA: type IV pilus twitching motility protein PilT [Thermotogota bacterium]|nr:type IV pilus twitching motility protein PilT [Thermotogota bacterium]HPJ87867.1 type IV pilus twitching motility protein PilT [Thermotogota bacterium]
MAVIDIPKLIYHAYRLNASDVHLSVGEHPVYRVFGELQRLQDIPVFSKEELEKSLEYLYEKINLKKGEQKELDFSFGIKDVIRVRANIYFERRNPAAAFRIITKKVRTLDELKLPVVLKDWSEKKSGLILVAGPTGSGKSTSMAAMLEHINTIKNVHILTVEDPIEYIFESKKALVHQRELGLDTDSFKDGLKYALRQDPDVILVGEMRDLDTMALALTAAETGHLVFGTIHTNSAPTAPERIIDVFPAHQQKQITLQLANSLIGVLYQRLIRKADDEGFFPVAEIMLATPGVRNLIREQKLHQIGTLMETGKKFGMKPFDDALIEAYENKIITKESVLQYCRDTEKVGKKLGTFRI